MKKLTLLFSVIITMLMTSSVQAIHTSSAPMAGMMSELTVGEMLSMNAREFQLKTGQKLNLKERIGYGLMKGQMKKAVKQGKISTSEAVAPAIAAAAAGGTFNIGAFLLGLFLGLIGVLIVALAFNDKKAWVWSLLGWGIWIVILVTAIL